MKQKRPKITTLIITYNEEDHIDEVLNNVAFTDEIIVVDSYSIDKTAGIIKKFGHVKLIQKTFLNFSDQRNFAISCATNDWILFIDADERLSEALIQEIKEVVSDPKGYVAFEIYRQLYVEGKILRFSGYQTDKTFRLFHKNYSMYNKDKFVHETLIVQGKTKILKNKLAHYSYKTYSTFKKKMENYARLRARELYLKGLQPTFYHTIFKPIYRFFNHFFIRLGFLDGKNGYLLSKLNAYGVRRRYIELQKLQEVEN